MIKLLHISDMHLNSCFVNRTNLTCIRLKKATRQALKNAINFSINNQIDAVFIAGDVIDSYPISFEVQDFIIDEVRLLISNKIHVVICTGNHDYSGYEFLKSFTDDSYFHLFSDDQFTLLTLISRAGVNFRVAGVGHKLKVESRHLIQNFLPKYDGDPITIGISHANVVSVKNGLQEDLYLPVRLEDIRKLNYDYFALGHIHIRTIIDSKIAYSGCIQGQHINEIGPKGGLYCEIDHRGTTVKTVDFHEVEFQTLTQEILPEIDDFNQLIDFLVAQVTEFLGRLNSAPENIILRISLFGETKLYTALQDKENLAFIQSKIMSVLKIMECDCNADEITPYIFADEIMSYDNVYSSIFKLIGELESQPELMERIAEHPLYEGLTLSEIKNKMENKKVNLKRELKKRMYKENL